MAAYLVVGSSPELTADKLAVFKRRADELLEHEIQVRRATEQSGDDEYPTLADVFGGGR